MPPQASSGMINDWLAEGGLGAAIYCRPFGFSPRSGGVARLNRTDVFSKCSHLLMNSLRLIGQID